MKRNKRLPPNRNGAVNFTYIAACVLMLTVSFAIGNVNFTARMKGISLDLGRALHDVFKFKTINYTPIDTNATYVTNVEYDPKGMAGLYNVTRWFMDLVQPQELFPSDVAIIDDQGNFQVSEMIKQWPSLLKHYVGLLTLTILGLLFAVLMPIIGFIFCCCRCCGNCGARSQPFDKKHDMCRKVLLAMFLIAVATLILFGVVCSFVSNKYLQDGTDELPNDVRDFLQDFKTFMNLTDSQLDTVLVTNYGELQTNMLEILDNATNIIEEQLKNYTQAVSFTNLENFVNGLQNISANLTSMKESTTFLRIKASQLSDGLRRVKHELLYTLDDCSNNYRIDICITAYGEVTQLSTTVDFDGLPDVTKAIDDLQNVITKDNLIEEMKKGKEQYQQIPENIAKAVNDSVPALEHGLKQAGSALKDASSQLDRFFGKLLNTINTKAYNALDQGDHYLQQYSTYRYYIGIFVSTLLLLIIISITLGLMCGVCGKRPDGYDDDCCNKGAGSKFLMLAVAIIFLFTTIIMLVIIACFLSGVVLQRFACDTLRDPDNSEVFSILDKKFNLTGYLNASISNVIHSCNQNKSFYNVFQLDQQVNISDVNSYLDKYHINDEINDFIEKIHLSNNVTILTNKTEEDVRKLKDSDIASINFDKFIDINDTLTTIDLNKLADQLKNASIQLSAYEGTGQLVLVINQNEMYLRTYQRELVKPMVDTTKDLKEKAKCIDEAMKFGHYNFSIAIDDTLQEVKSAQDYINYNGTILLKQLAEEFGDSFSSMIKHYLSYVSDTIMNDVGRCGPISNIYNGTLVITCDKILNPWNGFWLSVGWCVILFIPTIILSVKLATLYQKSDPYPGPLVEQEYLYDAYGDRDNIPLSNTNNKKGKKKKKRDTNVYESHGYCGESARSSEVNRGGASGSVPPRERDAPGGSSHPDTRYADMAPKHWEDYPNGGPPQYQSTPLATEYERPPPYYYPGPDDRP